jgi:hypothetical protein
MPAARLLANHRTLPLYTPACFFVAASTTVMKWGDSSNDVRDAMSTHGIVKRNRHCTTRLAVVVKQLQQVAIHTTDMGGPH